MRVLLAGMSSILSSIVSAILMQAQDVIIAGVLSETGELAREIRNVEADVVLLRTSEPGNIVAVLRLLRSHPSIRIVAISSDGQHGFVHELRPSSVFIPELSSRSLLTAMGAAAPSNPC